MGVSAQFLLEGPGTLSSRLADFSADPVKRGPDRVGKNARGDRDAEAPARLEADIEVGERIRSLLRGPVYISRGADGTWRYEGKGTVGGLQRHRFRAVGLHQQPDGS